MSAAKDATRRFLAGILMLPAALLIVVVGPNVGEYEGKVFPVAASYTILKKTPVESGGFDIDYSFVKLRKCPLKTMNLSIEILPNIFKEFSWNFTDGGLTNRPTGNWYGSLHTTAPASLIDRPIRLIAFHYCHTIYLWETETLMLDQSKSSEFTIKKDATS